MTNTSAQTAFASVEQVKGAKWTTEEVAPFTIPETAYPPTEAIEQLAAANPGKPVILVPGRVLYWYAVELAEGETSLDLNSSAIPEKVREAMKEMKLRNVQKDLLVQLQTRENSKGERKYFLTCEAMMVPYWAELFRSKHNIHVI